MGVWDKHLNWVVRKDHRAKSTFVESLPPSSGDHKPLPSSQVLHLYIEPHVNIYYSL